MFSAALCYWLLLIGQMVTSSSATSELHGRVLDPAGRPVEDVTILYLAQSKAAMKSGQDGSFQVELPAGPLLIEHPAYAPALLLPQQMRGGPVTLLLKDRATAEWRVPRCATGQVTDSPIKMLELKIPRGFRQDVSRDVDYELVTIRDRSRKFELFFWRTVMSRGYPSSTWLRGITRLTIRPLNLAETTGYDVAGWSDSGRQSRSAGCLFTVLEYSNVEPSVARQFDAIIDSACYR